jgi:sugar-phosphatase
VHDQICKVTLTTTQDNNQQILMMCLKSLIFNTLLQKWSPVVLVLSILLFQTDIKAYGLQFLQQKWGIDHQEVLAIGDNYNDQEMIEMAGYGFAMANAVPKLKQTAQYFAPTNEQQGVLEVIDAVLQNSSLQRYKKTEQFLQKNGSSF